MLGANQPFLWGQGANRTVREMLEGPEFYSPTATFIATSLGIDPDMSVETLKRLLLWGARVDLGEPIGNEETSRYWAWLTREEDH